MPERKTEARQMVFCKFHELLDEQAADLMQVAYAYWWLGSGFDFCVAVRTGGQMANVYDVANRHGLKIQSWRPVAW